MLRRALWAEPDDRNMKARYRRNVRCDRWIYDMTDRQGEEFTLHLLVQVSSMVSAIEFKRGDEKIPIPEGIVISIRNLRTGAIKVHTPDMGRVVWFHARHGFRVEYYGTMILDMSPPNSSS